MIFRKGFFLAYFFLLALTSSPAKSKEFIIKLEEHVKSINFDYLGFDYSIEELGDKFILLKIHGPINLRTINQINEEFNFFKNSIQYSELNKTYFAHSKNKIYEILDPLFSQQWGMKMVNAKDAWDITTGSKEVIIGLIDTGVNFELSEIRDNIFVNEIELNGENGIDDDQNGYIDDIYGANVITKEGSAQDDSGHGTSISSIIASKHNQQFIAGVTDKVRILPVKFLGDFGSGTTSGAIKAIRYAVNMGAKILSNSWGGGEPSQALKDTIAWAMEKDVLFVVSAGNNSLSHDEFPKYPASYGLDNIITVASVDENMKISRFSDYGKKTVDLAAPGENILNLGLNNSIRLMSGTSFATPFVSGAAALILSNNQGMPYQEIKRRLLKSVIKSDALEQKLISGGVLNISAALKQ